MKSREDQAFLFLSLWLAAMLCLFFLGLPTWPVGHQTLSVSMLFLASLILATRG